jgi:rubrerythrin
LAVDIPDFLIVAAELEMLASKLYLSLADLSPGSDSVRQLRSLANEEVNHANILNRGKEYYEGMPDFFSGQKIGDDELWVALEEAKRFQALLIPGFSLLEGLERMLRLERRFEKIHMDSSVGIVEPSLKKHFVDLMRGDQSHMALLKKLIESLGTETE